jgi:hypothetical protein
VLSLGLYAIAWYCYSVSANRLLWSDELFGWMLLTDPSFTHMISSWKAGADGGGIIYYLLGRVWMDVLGHSSLAFRAFSAAACFLGFCFMWFAQRRYYRPEFVGVSLFVVWFGSHTIIWQMVQGRFYGLLLGATAFALYASIRSAKETADGQSARRLTLGLTFVAHLLLVGAHPLGVVYSGIILGTAALNDILHRRRRFSFYLASLLAWSVLLFSIEAMRNTAAVGKPYFWTTTPMKVDLLGAYTPDVMPYILFVVITAFAALATVPERARGMWRDLMARGDILLPALVLVVVPVAIWFYSQCTTSIFVDRYMLPFTLGIVVIVSELMTQLFPEGLGGPVWMKAAIVCLSLWMLQSVEYDSFTLYPKEMVVPPLDFTAKLVEQLPRGVPIVFERVDAFDVTLFRHPDLPILYLLDWDTVMAPETPHGMVSGHHEMENWMKVGYFRGSILQSKDFLATTKDFVVVSDGGLTWFKRRIQNDPQWEKQQIGTFDAGYWSANIWRVHRH